MKIEPNAPPPRASRRIPGLDVIRAGAIVGVLLAHTSTLLPPGVASIRYLELADLGVDAFFALSGYLIGRQLFDDLADGSFSLAGFWRRRWLRTLPAYFFFLLLNLLVYNCVATRPPFFDWRYLVHLQNFAVPPPVFFRESWSLAVEEWFYLFTPLLLLALARTGASLTRVFAGTVAVLIGGAVACRTVGMVSQPESLFDEVRSIVIFRLDAIGVGVAIAVADRRGWFASVGARTAGLVTGALLVAGSIAWLLRSTHGLERDPLAVGQTLVLLTSPLGFALALPAFARIERLPWEPLGTGVRWIAVISYSLYLANPVLEMGLSRVARWSGLSAVVTIPLFWIGSLAVAHLSYHGIERPFLRRSPGRVPARGAAAFRDGRGRHMPDE